MASAEPHSGPQQNQQAMLARHRSKEAQQSMPPTAPNGATTVRFPMTYSSALSEWWAGVSPAVTENKVLSFIPYLKQAPTHTQTGTEPITEPPGKRKEKVEKSPEREAAPVITDSNTDPYGPRRWHSDLVQLQGKDRFLNEFSVERVGEETSNNLVMIHGYGAGLGFFFRNFDPLSRPKGWKLYALDMLGMGRSSRPPFSIRAKTREDKISEAEAWFVDSLEEWRMKRGIERFTLLGHSLGGYMAVAYALKYPGRLNKLILASPVGIPEDPYAVSAALPEPQDSTLASEFTQSQDATTSTSAPPTPRKPLPKWLTTLWDANISPFSFVRLSGPLGPRLVSGWTSRRFSHLPPDQAEALHSYSYSLFRQRGSGEYALAYILAPGAYARSPLIRRIQDVGRGWISPALAPGATQTSTAAAGVASSQVQRVRETGIPVVFLYGENDWMDVNGGHAATEKIRLKKHQVLNEDPSTTEEQRRAENSDAKVIVIRKAGHHVYLDSAEHFNEVVTNEMKDVEVREKRLGYQK